MKINSVGSRVNFEAKLSKELKDNAFNDAKLPEQKAFLKKRIKEIESYGDKNTYIHYGYNCAPTCGRGVSIIAVNDKLPKRLYSPMDVKLPLYLRDIHTPYNTSINANAYDIVTMITPERVYKCEKSLFEDVVRDNKLDAFETLSKCKELVAEKTYKAFKEAYEEIITKDFTDF